MSAANVALNFKPGTITPRQFGPTMRMWPRRASSKTCCSSAAPSGPISLKPAEIMIAPGMPAAAHSLMMPGTVFGGVMMTARSGLSGSAATFG